MQGWRFDAAHRCWYCSVWSYASDGLLRVPRRFGVRRLSRVSISDWHRIWSSSSFIFSVDKRLPHIIPMMGYIMGCSCFKGKLTANCCLSCPYWLKFRTGILDYLQSNVCSVFSSFLWVFCLLGSGSNTYWECNLKEELQFDLAVLSGQYGCRMRPDSLVCL